MQVIWGRGQEKILQIRNLPELRFELKMKISGWKRPE